MRGFAYAIAAVFSLAIGTPLAALLVAGVTAPYGASAHIDYPKLGNLIAGKDGAFDRFGQAIRERSPVTPAAIALKNAVLFDAGVIETSDVIMGRNHWFFYKDDFWGGRCLDRDAVAAALASVDALAETARAAGMEFVFAMAPDKSGVYPDKLDPIQAKTWNCKRENSALVDRLLAEEIARAVNHRAPLLASRLANDSLQLFYRGDTHWTDYGMALGVRQLLAVVFPDVPPPPMPRLTGATKTRIDDMANRMLLLPDTENVEMLDEAVERRLVRYARADTKPRTVIIHDSFYQFAMKELQRAFPRAIFVNISEARQRMPDIRSADRLIVERVERGLPGIAGSPVSWGRPLGRGILARNHAAAAACIGFQPARGPEVRLPATGVPCLSVEVEAGGSGDLTIFLPCRHTCRFEPGRSIVEKTGTGRHTLTYVLPASAAGQAVQLQTGGSAKIRSVAIGSLVR